MSASAHRITNIEFEKPSFSLWHDDKLMYLLDNEFHFYESLNPDNNGIVELPLLALRRAVAEIELDKETKESLLRDIADCESKGEDYVTYYCF